MKLGTLEDLSEVTNMALKFLSVSGYETLGDEETINELLMRILDGDKTVGIVLLEEGKGMLVATAGQFPYGRKKIATELAWWVEPKERKSGVGKDLLEAFEYWAKNVAFCDIISMSSLDDKVGKIYEKQGYKLSERAYMKVL